jgi:hypothetical protein
MQLAVYQQDEFFGDKQYRRISTRSTFDYDNAAHLIIDPDVDCWPAKEEEKKVAWYYMLANLAITTAKEAEEPKIASIKLEIPDWRKYLSLGALSDYFRGTDEKEIFMAQDVQREENEDYACSIYQMPDGVILAEAVHTRKPHCRAYKILESLSGMRGFEVFKYIDKNCQIIYPEKDEDEYMDEE